MSHIICTHVCIFMEAHTDTHKYTFVYGTHSKYIYIFTVESCHKDFYIGKTQDKILGQYKKMLCEFYPTHPIKIQFIVLNKF